MSVTPRGSDHAQRIAVARAPELLAVDDLSSPLDIETERALWRGLLGPSEGRRAALLPDSTRNLTILAVSHRRIVLQQADQVGVLKHGCINAVGRLEEVLAESAEIRHLWSQPIDEGPLG